MKQILVKRTATAGHEDRKHEEMRKNHSVSLNMKLSHFYCVWVFRLERVFQEHAGIFIKMHKATDISLAVLTLVTQSFFSSFLI